MTERLKLTIKKPLSLEKQSQLFQALKPLQVNTEKEKHQHLYQQEQKEKAAKQKKKNEVKAALTWLYENFSECFNLETLKPLKLNIDKDIFSFLEKENSPSKVKLRDALTYYTSNIHYLKAILDATHRYDLEGQQVEEITQEQKDFAREKLEKILQSINAKKQHKNKPFS